MCVISCSASSLGNLGKLKPFDTVLDIAESLQLKYGEFMEQVSEVEPFVTLDAVDAIGDPAHIE